MANSDKENQSSPPATAIPVAAVNRTKKNSDQSKRTIFPVPECTKEGESEAPRTTESAERLGSPVVEISLSGYCRLRWLVASLNSFTEGKGWILLALALVICILWTLLLMFLTIVPNPTVNMIMGTAEYDDGSFWMIVDPSFTILWMTVVGRIFIILCFLFIIIKLMLHVNSITLHMPTSRYSSGFYRRTTTISRKVVSWQNSISASATEVSVDPRRNTVTKNAAKLAIDMTHTESPARKMANVWIKIFDLGVQIVMIVLILESGTPLLLVGIFTGVVTINCLGCAIMIYSPNEMSSLNHAVIDCVFDLLITIGYPMLLLSYCLSTFSFDHSKYEINREIFPYGWFEREARLLANPIQISRIMLSLDAVRITSVFSYFTRMGANLVLCHRFNHIVNIIRDPIKHNSHMYPKKHPIAFFFVALAMGVIVFVGKSTHTSSLACSMHPECAVNAHRWVFGYNRSALDMCPCLTLIDEDFSPKTYSAWINPRNITKKVGYLAASGDLQQVYILNRQLAVFPEELRRCQNLRHLTLFYSHTEVLPSWFKEFQNLEYLHITGNRGIPSLLNLPVDLFQQMKALTFLQLTTHVSLPSLPSFKGLWNLRSVVFSRLLSVSTLPSFGDLHHLERLILSGLSEVNSLPDMLPLTNLRAFYLLGRSPVCCNGFLDPNNCTLSDPLCKEDPLRGYPTATCLAQNATAQLATNATLNVIKHFTSTTCIRTIDRPETISGIPTELNMRECNGTLYKQCLVDPNSNQTGICSNTRMMGIFCDKNILVAERRRRQIERGVGDPCNPNVEAWLGCKK